MPSRELADLSAAIESQDTDSFGKFYLYAALLHTITIRDKEFNRVIPGHSEEPDTDETEDSANLASVIENFIDYFRHEPAKTRINKTYIGASDMSIFHERRIRYIERQFSPPLFGELSVAISIFEAYFRCGALSDLIFIHDKMLAHLEAIHQNKLNKNAELCSTNVIGIIKNANFLEFFKKSKDIYDKYLSLLDNVINGCIFALIALAGIYLVTFLIPSNAIILMSVYSTLWQIGFFLMLICLRFNVVKDYNNLSSCIRAMNQKIKEMVKTVSELDSSFNTIAKNYLIDPVLKPLLYMQATIGEQLLFCPEITSTREELDRVFTP